MKYICFWSLSIFSYVLSLSFSLKKNSSRNLFISISYVSLNILLALINSPKIFYKFIANLLKHSSQSELNYFCISLELNSASPIYLFRSNRKGSTLTQFGVTDLFPPGYHLLQLHSLFLYACSYLPCCDS